MTTRYYAAVKYWLVGSMTLLSLLSCIATCALWVRSYSTKDQIAAYRKYRYSARLADGCVICEKCECSAEFTGENGPAFDLVDYSPSWKFSIHRPSPDPNNECEDSPYDDPANGTPSRPTQETRIELGHVPMWPIAAATAIPPLLAFRRLVQSGRRANALKANRCPICGYDLRATSDRCPECGTITSKPE
jgi:hypothetical protein